MGTTSGALQAIGDHTAEATKRVRDAEVRELADESLRAARSIIDSHRPLLDALAKTLLASEVLDRDDIDRIMNGAPPVAPRRIGELGVVAATAVSPAQPPPRR